MIVDDFAIMLENLTLRLFCVEIQCNKISTLLFKWRFECESGGNQLKYARKTIHVHVTHCL